MTHKIEWEAHGPRLLEALEEAANALDDVAECTWDRRHPDECRAACENATQLASGARDIARAAIAAAKGEDRT